ncbi:putative pectinesterase [Helianthus anomalus]
MYKGGGCDYVTVQEVVDVVLDWGYGRRFVMQVKEGVYEETVREMKRECEMESDCGGDGGGWRLEEGDGGWRLKMKCGGGVL